MVHHMRLRIPKILGGLTTCFSAGPFVRLLAVQPLIDVAIGAPRPMVRHRLRGRRRDEPADSRPSAVRYLLLPTFCRFP